MAATITRRHKSASPAAAAKRTPGPAPLSPRPTAKTADSKGRIVLGSRFANRPVILEPLSDTEVLVKLARIIPEREAWLYQDPQALSAVRSGLAQARARTITSGPNLNADAKLAAQLED